MSVFMLLSACVSSGRSVPAPVEDKGIAKPQAPAKSISNTPLPKPSTNSATSDLQTKPGYYTVKQGDTLIKIGLDHGQNWRDIMRWNAIENPNVIEVGQVLRITSSNDSEEVVVKPVTPPSNLAPAHAESKTNPQTNSPAPVASSPEVTDEAMTFAWPVQGNLMAGFDDSKNKGIDIGGKLGEPVLASADGKVVYAGSGLRGYGNLIILKHNNTFLTAYAHNQSLLVKEDQLVKRGQKIAEMGSSDADAVKLHFEIRKMGKPVDPSKFLPPR